jgi:hypothetical protein
MEHASPEGSGVVHGIVDNVRVGPGDGAKLATRPNEMTAREQSDSYGGRRAEAPSAASNCGSEVGWAPALGLGGLTKDYVLGPWR